VIGPSGEKNRRVMKYVVVRRLKIIENRYESRFHGGSQKAPCGKLRFPSWSQIRWEVSHRPRTLLIQSAM
jgi:hypothetical protein